MQEIEKRFKSTRANNIRKFRKFTKRSRSTIRNVFAASSKKPKSYYRKNKINGSRAILWQNAIEVGLADEIISFSEFIDRRNSMSKTEQPIDRVEESKHEKYRNEVLEIIRLCNLSKMPEKIEEFIKQEMNPKQVQEILMSILAKQTEKTEILSTIPQSSAEDLMMQVARSRAQLR